MGRPVRSFFLFVFSAGLLLLTAGALYIYFNFVRAVYGEARDQPSVLRYAEAAPPPQPAELPQSFDFDPVVFRQPPREFGPFTRWWWPGGDVEQAELVREIEMLAEAGFSGVEIQPFTMGLNPEAEDAERARVLSWDTDAYYQQLRATLDAAARVGLAVDLNGGSGWPTGGPHIALEDNFRTLLFSETDVVGGHEILRQLERPGPPLSAYLSLLIAGFIGAEPRGVYYPAAGHVEAVVAARVVDDGRSWSELVLDDQVKLDPASVIDVTEHVEDGWLQWTPPEGDWRVIAFWSLPDGESPTLIATREPGFVVDHFDAAKVHANYDYLFGKRSGLEPYYGKPLRAIFNDSYEFKADRHYAAEFLETFKRNRGYDAVPWLAAQMIPGYNHMFAHLSYPHVKPEFVYSDEDWRLRYDYDLTLSELLVRNFLDASADWMSRRGLQHRTQAYGMAMDVIAASGHADIPEVEQLFWGGSEAFLKAVSSGAMLYNRPVTTAESVVYMNRDHMTTPQKIKISVDKAFTSGVNQVIYHGTAYRYEAPGLGEEGWYPWSSPFFSMMGFATDLREANPFWKYVGRINEYIARSQYALRSGRPAVDVLLYYPFLGFKMGEESLNPEELLPRGELVGVEPPLEAQMMPFAPEPGELEPSASAAWFEHIWPLVNALEEQGVTWAWVNDESLQRSQLDEQGRWNIRGNVFEAVVAAYAPFIQVETAAHLAELANQGGRISVVGQPPSKQPSFLEYERNDRVVAEHFARILAAENAVALPDAPAAAGWAAALDRPIRYAQPYRHLRQVQRESSDGSRVVFVRSKRDEWSEIQLDLAPKFRQTMWLNPEDGAVHHATGSRARYALPPYGSVILFAATSALREPPRDSPPLLGPPAELGEDEFVAGVEIWNLEAGGVERSGVGLSDWREDAELRYASGGVYSAQFQLPELQSERRYMLDLGKVFFTADVRVNGRPAGSVIYAPYVLDISEQVQTGVNDLEITVTASQRNVFIGRAETGDERYKQFKEETDSLLPSGLAGPVRIWERESLR